MPVGKIKFNNVSKISSDTNILYLDDDNKLKFINDGNNENNVGTIVANVDGNVTGDVTGSSGSCTGNAATATSIENGSPNQIPFQSNTNTTTFSNKLTFDGSNLTVTGNIEATGNITGNWAGADIAGSNIEAKSIGSDRLKTPSNSSGQILISNNNPDNVGNDADYKPISGDATLDKEGTLTISNDKITTAKLADLNVTTAKLADLNVTTAKLADVNVTTAKLANGAVTTGKLADLNVTTAKLADVNVTTAKLANGAVTTGKLANGAVTNDKLSLTDGLIPFVKLALESGKIPSGVLPSYVDDIVEYQDFGAFPGSNSGAETNKIYLDKSTHKIYRWSGSEHVEISKSLVIGDNDTMAFAGDRGKNLEVAVGINGNGSNKIMANTTAIAAETEARNAAITEINSKINNDLAPKQDAVMTGTFAVNTNQLVVKSTGNVGIGTNNPQCILDIQGDAIKLPIPQNPITTGVNGMLRYNNTTNGFEGYTNGAWGAIAGSGGGSNLGPGTNVTFSDPDADGKQLINVGGNVPVNNKLFWISPAFINNNVEVSYNDYMNLGYSNLYHSIDVYIIPETLTVTHIQLLRTSTVIDFEYNVQINDSNEYTNIKFTTTDKSMLYELSTPLELLKNTNLKIKIRRTDGTIENEEVIILLKGNYKNYGYLSTDINVNDSGNVGIGTENPTEKLEVDGDVKINGDVIITGEYFSIKDNWNYSQQDEREAYSITKEIFNEIGSLSTKINTKNSNSIKISVMITGEFGDQYAPYNSMFLLKRTAITLGNKNSYFYNKNSSTSTRGIAPSTIVYNLDQGSTFEVCRFIYIDDDVLPNQEYQYSVMLMSHISLTYYLNSTVSNSNTERYERGMSNIIAQQISNMETTQTDFIETISVSDNTGEINRLKVSIVPTTTTNPKMKITVNIFGQFINWSGPFNNIFYIKKKVYVNNNTTPTITDIQCKGIDITRRGIAPARITYHGSHDSAGEHIFFEYIDDINDDVLNITKIEYIPMFKDHYNDGFQLNRVKENSDSVYIEHGMSSCTVEEIDSNKNWNYTQIDSHNAAQATDSPDGQFYLAANPNPIEISLLTIDITPTNERKYIKITSSIVGEFGDDQNAQDHIFLIKRTINGVSDYLRAHRGTMPTEYSDELNTEINNFGITVGSITYQTNGEHSLEHCNLQYIDYPNTTDKVTYTIVCNNTRTDKGIKFKLNTNYSGFEEAGISNIIVEEL